MIQRTLKEIQEMVGGTGLEQEALEWVIKGVSTDTRTLQAHNLYIPIIGEKFNGHHFLEQAIAHGATAALWCEREEKPNVNIPLISVPDTLLALQQLAKAYRQQLKTKVIGITGSNGKTSTKDILASLLGTRYRTQKTKGNLNNHLGVPLTLLELREDTEMAVIEMGMSGPGEIELLSLLAKPDIAIITNIGEAHLDYLKTKENILKAKLEILAGLQEDGLVVLNNDDPYLQQAAKSLTKVRLVGFGMEATNQTYPVSFSQERGGIAFRINERECPKLFLPLLGQHQMVNALGAIRVAQEFGVTLKEIQQGLVQIEATGMRNELIQADRFTIINDAYKSNPTSLKAALDLLYSLEGYRAKLVIMGDMNGMGTEEIKMHEEIGQLLKPEHIDYLFTIGLLAQHTARIASQRFPLGSVIACHDKRELLNSVFRIIPEQSVILIKGSRENELEHVVEQLQQVRLEQIG